MLRILSSLFFMVVCVRGDHHAASDIVYGAPAPNPPAAPAATPSPQPVYKPPTKATTQAPVNLPSPVTSSYSDPLYAAPVASSIPPTFSPEEPADINSLSSHFYSEVGPSDDYNFNHYPVDELYKGKDTSTLDTMMSGMGSMVKSLNPFKIDLDPKMITIIVVAILAVVFGPTLVGILGLSSLIPALITFINAIVINGARADLFDFTEQDLIDYVTQMYNFLYNN